MAHAELLEELARQVRRDTLQVFSATSAAWLTWAPPGTSNHMLWHAGHALWLQDVLCIQLLSGCSELPPGWAETFGMNCRPPDETAEWIDSTELASLLERQLQRVLELLAAATDEQLRAAADPARGPASVAARLIHGFHDEAKHCGEMYLLWKMCRARASAQ